MHKPWRGLANFFENILIDRTLAVVVVDPADFRSVSYTAVPEKTPDGKVPEYDEIDQEEEPPKANDSLVPAQAQSGSNHYCNTPQPPGNNHDSSIVSLLSVCMFVRYSPLG